MDWVKLATRYYMDPKVVGLDADAECLFIRGLAYAGDQETKGFIPEAAVPQLARRRRPATTVTALVEAGLWTRAPGGYRMPAWSTWQDQLDVLAARRAADRDRKRRERAEKKATTSNVRGQSRDVRALEGEEELDLPKGGTSTHDPPPDDPPPRKCQQHQDIDRPPPCGACADARRTHDAWHQTYRQPKPEPPPGPSPWTPPDVQDVLHERKNGYEPPSAESVQQAIAVARQHVRHPHAEENP